MPRETMEERRQRLTPGAEWLKAERTKRGWTQTELARRLGIDQERISAYERMQDQPSASAAAGFAREFGMPEIEVWRCLHLPLPAQAQTDDQIIAWAWEHHPEAMRAATGKQPPPKGGSPGRKDATHPRKGETHGAASHDEESAI